MWAFYIRWPWYKDKISTCFLCLNLLPPFVMAAASPFRITFNISSSGFNDLLLTDYICQSIYLKLIIRHDLVRANIGDPIQDLILDNLFETLFGNQLNSQPLIVYFLKTCFIFAAP